MCGIAGIWSSKAVDLEKIAGDMANRLTHRGPDDQGVWSDAQAGIALAHRRLSIIDLSSAGHQPMVSASERYVLSYNGEIYNFQILREQLDTPWCGSSDTEVLLAAIEAWGVEKALQTFNGMFAFALWDRKEQTLTLARDRIGEKPLYYGRWKDELIFASELKAFKALDEFASAINRDALLHYARYSYIAAPQSIYEGINKLEAGHYVTIPQGEHNPKPQSYWSLSEQMQVASSNRYTAPEDELVGRLEEVLGGAVKKRLIADVPLGSFLSGGIDSTAITLLMQQQSLRPVKSFSIGFDEVGFDEAPHAKAIANYLKTEHTELYVTANQALDVIPKLPQIFDEPFADSSQIPTYLVAAMAKEHVTVALSGDGGDELFGGYNRHIHAPGLWKKIQLMPYPLRSMAAHFLGTLPIRSSGHRQKLMQAMDARTQIEFYQSLCSIWHEPESLVIGASERIPEQSLDKPFAEWMMQQDTLTYLAGDILTKVDRAAMGVSLETRIPFLDPEVMNFAWQLPAEMKIRDGQGKWILRQLLYRHIPKELIDRPKAGFALPLGQWLRGSLREWAEALLDESLLRQQGYWRPEPILSAWKELLKGNDFMEARVWNVLMFQSWLESQ
ncbi:MAG: asparagine synthase (glutamine-hydrolyzing) [Rickettsiales bacterium]|nr:asparagine synthase (glutamine-hydrolyzing) [Rickettsiales bacterium]